MSKIHFTIPYPTFIESIVVYFLLRHRKKKYGFVFRKIKLHSGREDSRKKIFTKVEPEDYSKLSQYEWHYTETIYKNFYVFRIENGKTIYMHREIMNNPVGKVVDHKNREGLDNRKSNLRLATRSQNNCNRRQKKGTSKYRGVCYNKRTKKWRAAISFNGMYKHLGFFQTEEEAGRAYDEAAKIYHGEFASLNFNTLTDTD